MEHDLIIRDNETDKKLRDLVALIRVHALIWAVTMTVMLEDDAAMLAFMFS